MNGTDRSLYIIIGNNDLEKIKIEKIDEKCLSKTKNENINQEISI